jgi:hypothetical protein
MARQIKFGDMRFVIFMVRETQAVVFWDMKLCSHVVGYQHFGGPSMPSPLHFILKKVTAWSSKTLVSYHINTES